MAATVSAAAWAEQRSASAVSLCAGSLVYDFISSRREARDYNSHHKIKLTPMVTGSSTGLALGGAF